MELTPQQISGQSMATKSWPREVLDRHYRSFKKVTIEQVRVREDENDLVWVIIEPSEMFRGLGPERLWTAGDDDIPDWDVIQELIDRSVEVTIIHNLEIR